MKNKTNLFTVCLFVALLFGFSIAFLILPDNSFSEQENRSLRTLPSFSIEKLADGRFGEEINDYFADQFPLRDALVGLKGISEISLFKGENNGILLGTSGQLADRLFEAKLADGSSLSVETDGFDPDHVRGAADALGRVSASLKLPFTVFLTGRTVDVATSAFHYPDDFGDALRQTLYDALPSDVDAIDSVSAFRKLYDEGAYVYYKTDHHWTTLGAYQAYVMLMRNWGMENEILPADAFDKQIVSTNFYGTAWSAGGMKFVLPDTIEFWLYGNEDEFTVIADGKLLDGFYNPDYLARKDKYSAFLDGTHDVLTITKEGEDRPVLLLLKDSFANSLAPFLAQHFDLVLLNLSSARSDFTDLSALCGQYGADRALLVYTLENVVTANKLNRLR